MKYIVSVSIFVLLFSISLPVLAQDATALLATAQSSLEAGEYDRAVTEFEAARTAALNSADRVTEGFALMGLGQAHEGRNDYFEARNAYDRALGVFRQLPDNKAEEAYVQYRAAYAYADRGDIGTAQSYYQAALRAAEGVGETGLAGEIRMDLGQLYLRQSDFIRASEQFELAAGAFSAIIDGARHGQALRLLGSAQLRSGDFLTAIDTYRNATDLYRRENLPGEIAITLHASADLLLLIGDVRAAIPQYEEALELYRSVGNIQGEGRVLAGLGSAYTQLDYDIGLQYIDDALRLHQDSGDEAARATTFIYQGEAYLRQGDAPAARNSFRSALTIAENQGNIAGEAGAYMGLVKAFNLSGGNERATQDAFEQADQAINRYRNDLRDVWNTRRAFMVKGQYFQAEGRFSEADSMFNQALNEARRVEDVRGEIEVLLVMADAAYERLRFADVERHLNNAASLTVDIDDPALTAEVFIRLGRSRLPETDYDAAVEFFGQALFEYQELNDPTLIALALSHIGSADYLRGNYETALSTLREADATLDSASGEFVSSQLIGEVHERSSLYKGLIFFDLGIYDEALPQLIEAEGVARGVIRSQVRSYLGDYYYETGEYREAQRFYGQAARQEDDPVAKAMAQRGLALVNYELGGEPQEMRTDFDQALDQLRNWQDVRQTWRVLMGIASVDRDLGGVDNALSSYRGAQNEVRKVNNRRLEGYALLEMARTYQAQRTGYNQAVNNYTEAATAFEEAGDFFAQTDTLLALGSLRLTRSEYDEALQLFEQIRFEASSRGDRLREGIALHHIGQVWEARNDLDTALENYSLALMAITDTLDDGELDSPTRIASAEAAVYASRAELYLDIEQYALAETDIGEAKRIQQTVQADRELGRILSLEGTLLVLRGDLTTAFSRFTEAEALALKTEDEYGRGLALYGKARVFTFDDDPDNISEETTNYDQALSIFRNVTPDSRRAREVVSGYAESYFLRGDLATAGQFYNVALNEAQEATDFTGRGEAALNLAELALSRRRFFDAEQQLNAARRDFGRANNWSGEARVLLTLGDMFRDQVNYQEALLQYNNARQLYEENQDVINAARVGSRIGAIYQEQLRTALALDANLQALAILEDARTQDNSPEFALLVAGADAEIYRNLAEIQLEMAQYDQAEENLTQALSQAQLADNQREVAFIKHLQGNIQYFSGQYQEAIATYDEVQQRYQSLNIDEPLTDLYLDRGDAYFALAQSENAGTWGFDANQDYNRAWSTARDRGRQLLEIKGRNSLAQVQILLQQDNEAENMVQASLQLLEQAGDEGPEKIRALVTLGQLAEKGNNIAQATTYYEQAIELIENIHTDLRLETAQINFTSQNILPYHRLFELKVQAGDAAGAFAFAERSRARTFLFQMGNEQLDFGTNVDADLLGTWQQTREELIGLNTERTDLIEDINTASSAQERSNLQGVMTELIRRIERAQLDLDAIEERIQLQSTVLAQVTQVNVVEIGQLQSVLEPGTTMLSFYVVPESGVNPGNAYVFVITRDSFEVVSLNFRETELRGNIEAFRRNQRDTGILTTLYNALITPLATQNHLADTEKLLIVPHGILNFLPFDALTPDAERFLVDDFVIQYAPGATLYNILATQENTPGSQESSLILGNPLIPFDPALPPLPGAEIEAQSVADLMQSPVSIGQNATETQVWEQAAFSDVIHIAAHGVFNQGNPLSSYLALAQDGLNDGRLEVREIYSISMRERSPLVVLSACNTLTGVLSQGDEFQGLTRAFLISGASDVVASLWAVDDRATSELMALFYAQRLAGKSNAEALAEAKRGLRQSNPQWASPYFWAAFVLVGADDTAYASSNA